MKDTILGLALLALVIVGFWWTRGAGGLPGGTDDPARREVRQRFNELGDVMPPDGQLPEDRERRGG